MIFRNDWIARIRSGWRKRPIVWLSGVRRAGKTTLARMLQEGIYINCDLPSEVRRLDDPELFFRAQPRNSVIILDEVHRLQDPSRALKIAADVFPGLRILATGSSTLASTRKFRDTLTGRKAILYLPPILWTECRSAFGISDLDHRLLHGGLPESLLSDRKDDAFFAEWMDSFYARDIQELFGIRERTGFLNLLRVILRQSGGLADYSALSRECDISRATVKSYLEAMGIACALFALPPFYGGGRRELVRRPKVYGFDTGFVTFVRGWRDLREEDRGPLWEHLVLDMLRTATDGQGLFYWRDKSGREVDFVVRRGRDADTVECKISPDHFNLGSLSVFRGLYPNGRNYLLCPDVPEPFKRRYGSLILHVTNAEALMKEFEEEKSG